MQMSFDTLSFARRLTDAGETPAIAEAHALALKDFMMDRLATRDDLFAVRDELRGEIGREISSVRKDLGQEIADVRKNLSQEIADVRKDLSQQMGDVRKDIDVMGLKLTVRIGGMLAVAAGALATLHKVL